MTEAVKIEKPPPTEQQIRELAYGYYETALRNFPSAESFWLNAKAELINEWQNPHGDQ